MGVHRGHCEYAENEANDVTGVANGAERDVLASGAVEEVPGTVAVQDVVVGEPAPVVALACDRTCVVAAVGIALRSTAVPCDHVPWVAYVAEASVVEELPEEGSPWASLVVAFPWLVVVLHEVVVGLDSRSPA